MISKPDAEWNDEDVKQLFEKMLSKQEADWNEEDLLSIVKAFEGIDIKSMLTLSSYQRELASLSHYEASHPDVQAVVKKMYDFERNSLFREYSDTMTPQWYAQHASSYFTGSDMAVLNEKNLGKEGCEFIVKAIEYFGNHAE